jgi:hypothetical protein
MAFSTRSQIAIVWWSLGFAAVYGISLAFLLHMIPPPAANDTAAGVAHWYAGKADGIRVGAALGTYSGAFAMPLFLVIAVQISRHESGKPIWAITAAFGGAGVGLALALPPLFLGVAAFTTERAPSVTMLMHQLGVLTLITDVQWNVFAFVPIIVISLRPQIAPHSPFPRWYGYFTAWAAFIFEAGPIAFLTRTGPFAWNSLFPFWMPVILFGGWIAATAYLLLGALGRQLSDATAQDTEASVAPA